MPQPIQLGIPTPCQESWSTMPPAGNGRHCAACQKTVVDFAVMTDAEIVRHLARTGLNVCGRLAPDQLHRNLAMPSPPKRNGWSGWRYLLAGVLITSNQEPHSGSSGKEIQEQRMPANGDDFDGIFAGKISIPPDADTARTDSAVMEEDSMVMGTPKILVGDVLVKPDDFGRAVIDSIEAPPPLPVADSVAKPSEEHWLVGGIIAEQCSRTDSVRQFVADTLAAMNFPSLDSVKQFLTDTLLPTKSLTIYPNPAPRGSVIHLSWKAEPGTYQVTLTSIAGAQIGKRVIQINSKRQDDVWELPDGMVAGVYIIRAMRSGQTGGYTAKLMVQ